MRLGLLVGVTAVACVMVAGSALSNGAAERRSDGIDAEYAFDFDGAVPVEGFVSYVVLRRRPGNDVVRAELSGDGLRGVRAPLEPGRYRISAYQRFCSGTCSQLGSPVLGCGRTVRVRPGRLVRAKIAVRFTDEHCRIRLGN